MKIVNIIGGLGNQMFQYAFAVALKAKYPNEEVFIDTQHYKNAFIKVYHGNNFYHNGYEIDKVFPNATLEPARPKDLMKVSFYIPNQVLARAVRRIFPKRKTEFVTDQQPYVFIPEALSVIDDCYFDGYWMTPLYFDKYRDRILKEFTFRPFDTKENLELEPLLKQDNSVTVHIRRGDYVGSSSFGGICTLDYYRNAIREAYNLITSPEFFIFSNDQKWCMENMRNEFDDAKVHFIAHNRGADSYRDMQLLSIARCNILANSSFSWWGAYLNQRKNCFIICPHKWHNTLEYSDLYLPTWIKI